MALLEISDAEQKVRNGPFPCGPVYRDALTRDWVATRFDDCDGLFRHPDFAVLDFGKSAGRLLARSDYKMPHIGALMNMSLSGMIGEPHRVIRTIFARTIASGLPLTEIAAASEATAQALWAAGAANGTIDVVRDYAEPMVTGMSARIFDIEPALTAALVDCVEGIVAIYSYGCSLPYMRAYETKLANIVAPILAFLANARVEARGDAAEVFANGVAEAGYSDIETTAALVLLFILSADQTAAEIALAVRALMADPDALAAWCAGDLDDGLAVDELLRFTTPVPRVVRQAVVDTEFGGQTILKGERISQMLGSANMDPAAFESPDRLLLDRTPNPHMSFSQGGHVCIGKKIARIELIAALQPLRRFPPARVLTPEIRWWKLDALRRMTSFRIGF